MSNGALIQTENPKTQAAADLTLTLTKAQLLGLLAGHGLDGIEHTGDPAALSKLTGLLDTPRPRLRHHHPVTTSEQCGDSLTCDFSITRAESAQFLMAMKYILRMSPSTCTASMEVNPASRSISRAFCSPHMAPRPIPSSARETVMQCMHEMV